MTDLATTILSALALIFAGLIYYVYDGYLRLLRIIDGFTRRADRSTATVGRNLPSITVLIAVHNEAHQIVDRIQNVIDQDYPSELLDIVVASDGSTDGLGAVVAERFGANVRLVQADRRVGKSAIQNQAVETIHSSIVLFSDADTRFTPGFLRALVAPFADAAVGAVQAHLLFVPADPSLPVPGQARYWRAELEIRQREANLGILAVASGACIAVRRELWRPLDLRVGDDCMIPLDVVAQSKQVAYAEQAIAHEPEDPELGQVVSTRARMTMRNWQGTWSRPTLLNPFRHPGYALALWSHKILRWLSPIWLLGLTVCAVALAGISTGALARLPAAAMLAVYLLAIVGAVAHRRSRRVPVCTDIYSFLLANLGFLHGLVKAARGTTITRYRGASDPTDRDARRPPVC